MAVEGGEEADFAKTKSPKHAPRLPNFTKVPRASTERNLINLQIKEFKKGKTQFLFDTEAPVILIKLRNLREEILIYKDKMTSAGVTRHKKLL